MAGKWQDLSTWSVDRLPQVNFVIWYYVVDLFLVDVFSIFASPVGVVL